MYYWSGQFNDSLLPFFNGKPKTNTMEEKIKITKIGVIRVDDIKDNRRINPFTYELTGEWENGLYVFDNLMDSDKINFIVIIDNNKVIKSYTND